MKHAIIVQTTTDNPAWTEKLVCALLNNHLCADMQVSDVRSHYWWDGAVRVKNETLLVLKTRAELYPAIEAAIIANSEYDVPQIIVTPIVCGSEDYMKWIIKETEQDKKD